MGAGKDESFMIACFDIGGTAIKYGVAREYQDSILFDRHWEIPTNAKQIGGPGIQDRILQLVAELKDNYTLEGVAISTAGMVDSRTGVIIYANNNIPDYIGINMKTAVEEKFSIPTAVENDVNCAALGELAYGAAKGSRSVLCLTIGTGVGGAIILNDEVWHGATGSAGEIGYIPLNGGTFESQASTTALVQAVADRSGEALNGRQIFERAKANDPICLEEVEHLCEALAKGLAACICVLNPETVVLGGGIMAQHEFLRPRIEKYLQDMVNPFVWKGTTLAFATLGNHAGMAGAYYWFKKTALSNL